LNQINFGWKVSKRDNGAWERKYNELKEFKNKEGHCNIPQKYKKNPSLGIWVSTQRQAYKKYSNNKVSSLTESRFEALENIDFTWIAKKAATHFFS